MQTIHDEKEQQGGENQDLTKKKAKLELNIKDIQDELEGDKTARVTIIYSGRIYFQQLKCETNICKY